MMDKLRGRVSRGTAIATLAIAALNVYAVWPALGTVGKVAAVPVTLAAAYLWVRVLQFVFGLLSRGSGRAT